MIEKRVLENGVTIISEHMSHVRSVSLGLWWDVGSRYERAGLGGASHYIEHLLFKGTNTRTAVEIAEEMDRLGGGMNAFTTKECTCFYARVLDVNLAKTVELLADMFFHSKFDEEAIDAERGVICEEIDMYEDSPDDLVTEQLMEAIFPNDPLGAPILGTKKSLAGLNREALLAYKEKHYTGERLVIAVSGNVKQADLDYIQLLFSNLPQGEKENALPAKYEPAIILAEKQIEQNHLCLMFPGLSMHSEERYAGQLLSSALGGGVSSRLFQKVREEHGLCYSVYSFGSSFHDVGTFGIYAALNKQLEEQALGLILEIIEELLQSGLSQAELERAREQAKSSILLSLESTSARMNRLGRNQLYRGRVLDIEEVIGRYDAVSAEDVQSAARVMLDKSQLAFSAVGQVSDEATYRKLLAR